MTTNAMPTTDVPAFADGGEMEKCPQCGYMISVESEECPFCGEPMGMDDENDPNEVEPDDDADDMPANTNPRAGLPSGVASEKVLTTKSRNALPDSKFLYITPDGKRMFPVQDKAHIRNALSRIPQSKLPDDVKARLIKKAKALAKKNGIDTSEASNQNSSLIVDSILTVPTITESIVDGATVHKGRLLVSVADRVNRNNRIYPASVWQREAAKSLAKIKSGMLTGQAEHPEARPDLLNTILKFTDIVYESGTNNVYADFTVIPTAKGRDFTEIVKAGVAVGCSTRGSGTAKREKRNGTEVSVIQDDYNLEGIDVMLFGEQSVESAKLMQFEHLETNPSPEPHMPDKIESLVALREAYPALLTEAEKPLNDKLAETVAALEAEKVQVTEAKAKVTELTAQAEAAQTKLTEAEKEVATLREDNEKLKASVTEAAAKVAAKDHLVEVAKQQKQASWLVLEFLKDAPTPEAVDEGLKAAVKKAESLIEVTLLTGQGVHVAKPEDSNDTPQPDKPETQYPAALSMATGTRIRQ